MTLDFQGGLALISAPLTDDEVEWRIQQAFPDRNSAMVLCYPTARTVMDRFDAAFGPQGWQNSGTETKAGQSTGYKVGIGVCVGESDGILEWVWKYDVCDCSDIEAMKGAWSGAMKRAAVQWGLGRELYKLGTTWVDLVAGRGPAGSKYHKGPAGPMHWVPPTLGTAPRQPAVDRPPQPARPAPAQAPPRVDAQVATPAIPATAPGTVFHGIPVGQPCPGEGCSSAWPCTEHALCPACGGPCWDNRREKRNPKAPDFKCKDKGCGAGERDRDHISGWWTNEWAERINKLVSGEPVEGYCGNPGHGEGGGDAYDGADADDGPGWNADPGEDLAHLPF